MYDSCVHGQNNICNFVTDFHVYMQKKTGIFLHLKKKTNISDKTVLIDYLITFFKFHTFMNNTIFVTLTHFQEYSRMCLIFQVAKNERPRLITEANTTRREAESEADIILNKARSDARILQNR